MTTLTEAVEALTAQNAELVAQTESLLTAVNTRKADLDLAETSASESAAAAALSAALLGSVTMITATGTVTLVPSSAVYQLINPNGSSCDVVLPDLEDGEAGRAFSIKNTGTVGSILTIKNQSGVQVGPLLANGYTLAVLWTGAAWEVL